MRSCEHVDDIYRKMMMSSVSLLPFFIVFVSSVPSGYSASRCRRSVVRGVVKVGGVGISEAVRRFSVPTSAAK